MKKIIENLLLYIGLIIIFVVFIFFKMDIIAFLCSIVAIACAFFIAKGKTIGNVFGILLVIFYSIISFRNKLYGEVILYIFIMLPLYIYSTIEWKLKEKKDSKTVIAYEITDFEWAILSASEILLFTVVYLLLKKLNTESLLLSTFSFVSLIYAVYLGARRSKYTFIWYFINDIVLVLIWTTVVILNKNYAYFPIVISTTLSCLYDIYGIICWENNNRNIIKVSNLDYRKLTKKDRKEVMKVIDFNAELQISGKYISYTEEEKNNLFKEEDILLYGIFDKKRLVGKSELHINQNNLKEIKKVLGLEKYRICVIRRVLDIPEYRHKKILQTLIELQIKKAKEMAFNYITVFVHPDDILCKKAIRGSGFNYVKTELLESGDKREFYIIKV